MDDHVGVLLEDIQDQQRLTLELLQTVVENQRKSDELLSQIPGIADDVRVVKVAVKDHSKRLQVLEQL